MLSGAELLLWLVENMFILGGKKGGGARRRQAWEVGISSYPSILINPLDGQAQKELISGIKDKKYWHE